jgi:hypothetical protein
MDRGGWVGLPAAGPGLFFLVTISSVGGVQISSSGVNRCIDFIRVRAETTTAVAHPWK